LTKEDFRANRKAAGREIDVETCDVTAWYVDLDDPYGLNRPPSGCIAKTIFVASAESGGWVLEDDLPKDKWRALRDRIERGDVKPNDEPF
jgi:hypothetical protein